MKILISKYSFETTEVIFKHTNYTGYIPRRGDLVYDKNGHSYTVFGIKFIPYEDTVEVDAG